MVTASPDTLGTVASQILKAAADQASTGANELGAILDKAEELADGALNKVTGLPADLLQRLKNFAENPNWQTLLIFAFLRIRDLDAQHLSVGTMHVPDWSRAVAMTYTTSSNQTLTLAIAVGDKGSRHGLHIRATGPLEESFGDADALHIGVHTKSACAWDWEFGQSASAPDATGGVTVSISWALPVPEIHEGAIDFKLGPLHVDATLSKDPGAALYTVDLGLGDREVVGRHGITATGSLKDVLKGLGNIVELQLPVVDYSPELTLQHGASPKFSLGNN